MSFANDILDAIEIMVKQVVEDNATKIYTGVCKTIGTGNCVLTINGKDNTVKYYGGVPVVGTVYQVFIPFGNMSAAFIIVPGSGGGSGGSGVDSVNGMTGDVVLNAADVRALPTSGGTLTGKLTVGSASINTNGYVVGTWLQGTATNHLTNAATKIAVQDGSGWVYHRTAEEIKSDIGLSNVDNVKQYSASNPPPYPVASVNGKTGGVNLIASDVGAAPAGYGLGMNSNGSIYDADNITAFGFYTAKTNTPTNDWCAILNIPYGQNRATQFSTLGEAVSGDKYSYCKREKINGIWKPWEWVNPRMSVGVEYRTTERYLGKPVYAMAVDFGNLPNATTKEITVRGASSPDKVVSVFGYTSDSKTIPTFSYGWGSISTISDAVALNASAHPNLGLRINVATQSNRSSATAVIIVKYTKSTD